MNANVVILIGRLTRDPEVKFLPSGTAVCEAGLASNRYYKDKAGNRKEEVYFAEIELWGKKGEAFAEYARKGRLVYIQGRLKLDTWEKDGRKYSKTRVVCEKFEYLESKKEVQGSNQGQSYSKPTSAPTKATTKNIAPETGGEFKPKNSNETFTVDDDEIPF